MESIQKWPRLSPRVFSLSLSLLQSLSLRLIDAKKKKKKKPYAWIWNCIMKERAGSVEVEAMLSRTAPIFNGDIRSHERVK